MSLPPPSTFRETLRFHALRVPARLCNDAHKALRPHVLALPHVASVLRADATEPALVVLLLRYLAESPATELRAPPRGNADAAYVGVEPEVVATRIRETALGEKVGGRVAEFVRGVGAGDVIRRDVLLGYEVWGMAAVLRNVLPEGVTVPTSFETVGHIVHVNLREEHEEYKKVIGAVMLDKLGKRVKTVVNKLESTGGPYRTFKMEVIAGEPMLETEVKENGCRFRLNFEKVYWNSRLETEHNRIVTATGKGEVFVDAFCGIGPFAVPVAKGRRCEKVYANDLNPDSVKYLKENAKINGVEGDKFIASCGCAREFLRTLVRDKVAMTRVVMNFPSGAPEFLDVFRGLYDEADGLPMPVVHCYCFVKGIENLSSARDRVRKALYGDNLQGEMQLRDEDIEIRDIRNVAPRKQQVCVTFQVPKDVAHRNLDMSDGENPPAAKKLKLAL
ncbi:unnamed protein product [Chondrus crispus]|uniref:tRNA (guanine(37)-N1)-methyltransferase n=1 Tax=Chondrus crispus TaxID=2769 RepID=R7Q4C6_CHOCR|nr:unnamed protein product [Chondrus crispus]CDF32206.1 unnamed protein product [Chondrus crispus]|eukprot:XP_005711871.1 unnamed protein product [Chondrus crispus]